ncbi:hypothetical protein KW787_04130 [Candidatus Pacearchaeota archaeon]|nr:hypothetical protein [Candidatus Pacearchaeota archaeon]
MEEDNVIDWSSYGKGDFPKMVAIPLHCIKIKKLFKTIEFVDVVDYQISPSLVAISMQDKTVHFYPTKDITYIKSYFKENI